MDSRGVAPRPFTVWEMANVTARIGYYRTTGCLCIHADQIIMRLSPWQSQTAFSRLHPRYYYLKVARNEPSEPGCGESHNESRIISTLWFGVIKVKLTTKVREGKLHLVKSLILNATTGLIFSRLLDDVANIFHQCKEYTCQNMIFNVKFKTCT
jgi:hypothetical protein